MLGGDKLVLEVRRLLEGILKQLVGRIGKRRLRRPSARYFGQALNCRHRLLLHRLDLQAHPLQQWTDDAFVVLQQSRQYVDRLQLRIAMLAGEVVRPLHRLLGLYG